MLEWSLRPVWGGRLVCRTGVQTYKLTYSPTCPAEMSCHSYHTSQGPQYCMLALQPHFEHPAAPLHHTLPAVLPRLVLSAVACVRLHSSQDDMKSWQFLKRVVQARINRAGSFPRASVFSTDTVCGHSYLCHQTKLTSRESFLFGFPHDLALLEMDLVRWQTVTPINRKTGTSTDGCNEGCP